MSTLNPDRLLKCYGQDCEVLGLKHPAKTLQKFSEGTKQQYCPECYSTEYKKRIERKKLEETICRHFKIPSLTANNDFNHMIRGQIKRFEKSGITLKNIRLALDYFVIIRGNNLESKYGIAIAARIQDEMKLYYRQLLEKQKTNQIVDNSVVHIKMGLPKKRFDYKASKQIDMEELNNELNINRQ